MSEQILQDAQRHHRAGRVPQAWGLYVELLRANPQAIEAYQALGTICFQSGEFDRAAQFLSEALRLNPLSADDLCLCGQALLRLQRHHEALACFDSALSLRPGYVEALTNRALAYAELQQFEQALATYDTVLHIDPNHAVSWSDRGNVLTIMRRFQDAVASYDRALAIRPDLPETNTSRKYALGMSYFEKRQYNEAQYILEEAVRLNPRLLVGLCIRGIALLQLKRHQDAIACFDRALAVQPDFVEALINRATAYLELNRMEDALAGFDAALAVDPNHAVSWHNRGNALAALNRLEEAVANYDKALAIAPEFQEAKDNRASALFEMRLMSRCPEGYIRSLFDQYAPYYDTSMVEQLGYRGHLHLYTLAERVLPRLTPPWRILDLGPGTGLVGEAFKALAVGGRLDGIDLSPRMIEASRARNIYDDLILGDLETVLRDPGHSYDLILSADTMIYLGDLAPTFGGVFQRLDPGGFYIFAVEAKEGEGWEQTKARRFRHSEAYLRAASASAGLDMVAIMECSLRREFDDTVAGFAVALRKPVP